MKFRLWLARGTITPIFTPEKTQKIERLIELARLLLNERQHKEDLMYDRDFFTTRLGKAALLSIAAMVTFIALSGDAQLALGTGPLPLVAAADLA